MSKLSFSPEQYKKHIAQIEKEARIDELQTLLDKFTTIGEIKNGNLYKTYEFVEVNANFLRARIAYIKGESND